MQSALKWVALVLLATTAPAALGQPRISIQPRSQFAWEGKRVTLNVAAKGASPLSYQWQFNGTNINDATNRNWILALTQRLHDGSYRVLVTDATGSATSLVAQVMVRGWPQPTGARIAELGRFDTTVQNILQQYAIPGGSLAVVKDGRLVFARGYGWADVENSEPFQPDSLCRIDSLSKTITAATLLKLVEEGKLVLEAPALRLLNLDLPSYPGAVFDTRLTNITVRQLLHHTAGWNRETAKNPLGGTGFDPVRWPQRVAEDLQLTTPPTPTDLVHWMLGKPLQTKPGTQRSYSNVGYVVAGQVIEKLRGQPYETAARRLLAEAGITRIQLAGRARSDRVTGEVVYYLHPSVMTGSEAFLGMNLNWYEPKPLDFELPYAFPATLADAAWGFIASAIDYARFLAAVDGLPTFPDILATNTLKMMASGSLGWDSVDSINPSTGIWYKAGSDYGENSLAVKWRNGVSFVMLLNSMANGPMYDLYNSLTVSLSNVRWPTNDLFAATLSYDARRADAFSAGELADPSVSGDQADPDGDGMVNLLEYAQGTDPRVANEPSPLAASIGAGDGAPSLVVSFRRLWLAHELDYGVEASSDLQTWSSVASETDERSLNPDGTATASVRVGPLSDSRARFYRLRVSRTQ